MSKNVNGGYLKGEHAVVVLGYYSSEMFHEAGKLWESNKEQFAEVFNMGQKDITRFDKFLVEGVKMEALYDMPSATEVVDEVFSLGYYMEEYCTGENYKEAPKGGEDFGFYLVECAQALRSGLELIEEFDPLGDNRSKYFGDLYQSL